MRNYLMAALTLALLVGQTVAAPGKAEVTGAKPAKAVTVPFELLKSGHMAVKVKVNGKGPFKLIFDTGAPMSLINNKLAKQADLLKDLPEPIFPIFGTMGEAKIKTLEVGEAKVNDVSAIVMDHPTIGQLSKALGTEIYGLVGFPFFARFKMTIDYKAKTLTLLPSSYKPPNVMRALNLMLTGALFGKAAPKPLAPAAQWGIMASKEVGDEEAGVDVKEVVSGSAAEKAGLKRGDRLLTIDGRWTDSLPDLYEAASYVKAGTTVVVSVKRGGKEMEVKVTPAKGM
jgi:hypothetical protein